LIFLVIVCVALFIWLKVGIKADLFVFGKYKVEKLYIKLDKKLTFKAESISIPKSKANPSFDNIDKTFDTIRYLFTFFDYIALNKITFNNNHMRIIFANEILYITSDDYKIAGNIHRLDKKLVAEVSMLYIKKKNITLVGKLEYDLDTDILKAEGNFKAYNIKGTFNAKNENEKVDFKVDTSAFTDLRTLVNTFELEEDVKAWVVDKIRADSYRLRGLRGTVHIENDAYNVDYEALRCNLILNNAKIRYEESLEEILAKNVQITFKDKTLFFDLEEPTYLGRNLIGSKVLLTGLLDTKTRLELDLNITTPIDTEVQKVLKAYRLDIPVTHKGNDANLKVKMHIPLDDASKKDEDIRTWVKVNVGRGTLKYKKIVLPLKTARVAYNSTKKHEIIFDSTLKKGNIKIGKTNFPVRSGKIHYEQKIATLKNIHIQNDWYDAKVSGKINTKRKKANLTLNAKKIAIGGKNKVLLLKDKRFPFSVDYKKEVKVKVPSLALEIKGKKKGLYIKLSKLKKLNPYLQDISLKIDGGKLNITSYENSKYTFNGEIRRNACFLYTKNNRCYTKIPIHGKLSKNNLDIYAFSKRVHYNSAKSRIKIKNINIDLEKFLRSKKKRKKGKRKNLVILGKKSNIRYKKHTLVTDSYDLEVKSNGDVKAFGSLDGDIVKLSIKGKKFSLKALRVKDKMLHPLINFKGLKHGRYTIKQSGNPDKVMHGQIIVEGGVLSGFKTYNNTLAFINAIPAIATFSNPGFSEKGFNIEEGVVEYRKTGNRIIFDSIYIKGSSATIAGKGEIDIVKKTIKMDLAIQTAREFGKLVGSLPLVGYILMGKDKSMTIGLKISGSLNKPIVKTSAAEDILTLPLQLIKRTLESPAHILNN